MVNVFLSYSREDLGRAATVAAALEKAGLSVWWDERISGGSEYSKEIEQALRECEVVVVLWSRASVESPWVRDEAAKGRDGGKLVPATLDGTAPPIGFGQFQTIDLSKRGRMSARLRQLVSAAAARVDRGRSAAQQEEAAERRPQKAGRATIRRPLAIAAGAALVLIFAAVYAIIGNPFDSRTTADSSGGKVVIGTFESVSNDPQMEPVARLTAEAIERIFATNFIETVSGRSASAEVIEDADLGVRGTVDSNSDTVSVSTTIADLKSGRTLWSTRVERPAGESRELAEETAIWLADVLRCAMYGRRRIPEYDSAEVFARILRWCEAERSRGEQFEQLAGVARALIEVAPESAQAHAYLANALITLQRPSAEIYAAANKAIELEPENGAVRWALANIPDPSLSLAERERRFREGIKLDGDFIFHKPHLAQLMRKVGRMDEGRRLLAQFVGDFPLDHLQRPRFAYLLAEDRELSEARRQFEMTGKLRPDASLAYEATRAEALFGNPELAKGWLDRLELPSNERLCTIKVIQALAAKRATGAEAEVGDCRSGAIFPAAQIDIALGDVDRAYARLDDLVGRNAWIPRQGPDYVFDNYAADFRADPRFMPLMASLGVAQYWLQTSKWPDFCSEDRLTYDCREAARAAVASARR